MKIARKNKMQLSEKTPHVALSAILMSFIIMRIVYAVPPNPGHYFTEIGGGVVQGDILFGLEDDMLSKLAKDENQTRYLSNTGENNNPAWTQVDLSNGVTGNLSVSNLDSGDNADSSTFWRGDGAWETPSYKTFVGGGSSTSITASAICNPFGYSVCNTTLTTMLGATVPFDGTIKNLYGTIQTPPESGSVCTFTIRKSASCTEEYQPTTVTCNVIGDGTLQNCSDTSNTDSISAGDCVQIYYDESGTCTGITNWGFEITAQ